MVRQGDVLLVRVPSLPEGISLERVGSDRVALATSEATGHSHVVHGESVRLFAIRDFRYLTVERGAVLTHEEHDPIDIPAGVWEVRRQRQYERGRAERPRWSDVAD